MLATIFEENSQFRIRFDSAKVRFISEDVWESYNDALISLNEVAIDLGIYYEVV